MPRGTALDVQTCASGNCNVLDFFHSGTIEVKHRNHLFTEGRNKWIGENYIQRGARTFGLRHSLWLCLDT